MPKFITGRPATAGESANSTGIRPPAGYTPSGPVPVGNPPSDARPGEREDSPAPDGR